MDRFVVRDNSISNIPLSTGDCAAVAARAAAAELLLRIQSESVRIDHENGGRDILVVPVRENCNALQAEYYAVMEGGVSPDIKEKTQIRVTVSKITDFKKVDEKAIIDIRYANLFLQGGEGIAAADADKPGIKKGEALIDPNARKLIFDAVGNVCEISDGAQLLMITVSCPDGMMIAAKQTMGQSSFLGGIGIVGNYGKVESVHQRDITESIDRQINRQVQLGVKSVLVAPGDYCADKINMQLHVPLTTAVYCYNYPGQAIDTCVSLGVENLLLVGNVGKLVKLAAGIVNTNSYASDGRREIFAAHVALVGGTAVQVRTVMSCITCDEILGLLTNWGIRDRVMMSIMNSINEYGKTRSRGKIRFGVALFSEEFGLLGQTVDTKNVLVKVSQEQFSLSLKLK
jgi:cobalt-precorrin-5B (C1)-methyltransferase